MAVKHQLGGCENGGAPDTTLEQLSKVFLEDLHEYTYNDYKLELRERDEFNDVTYLISQMLKYQQLKNSTLFIYELETYILSTFAVLVKKLNLIDSVD